MAMLNNQRVCIVIWLLYMMGRDICMGISGIGCIIHGIYMIGHDVLAMVYIDFELSYGMLYVIGDRKSYGVV